MVSLDVNLRIIGRSENVRLLVSGNAYRINDLVSVLSDTAFAITPVTLPPAGTSASSMARVPAAPVSGQVSFGAV